MSATNPPPAGPANGTKSVSPSTRPPSMPPTPRDADGAFYAILRKAGLVAELSESLVTVLEQAVGAKDEATRRLDLLELYYAASGDIEASRRRAKADRVLIHHAGVRENAHAIVARLALANPELYGVRLERFGGDDGPLVLRAGEHVSAITEDDELEEPGTLAVRNLVQAFNVLLDRVNVTVRMVLLPADGEREVYVAMEIVPAIELCHAGCLEEDSAERLHEFAHF